MVNPLEKKNTRFPKLALRHKRDGYGSRGNYSMVFTKLSDPK